MVVVALITRGEEAIPPEVEEEEETVLPLTEMEAEITSTVAYRDFLQTVAVEEGMDPLAAGEEETDLPAAQAAVTTLIHRIMGTNQISESIYPMVPTCQLSKLN